MKNRVVIGTRTSKLALYQTNKVKQELKKKLQRIKKKDLAIVVGYGGSAKAIIYSLNFNGFKKIRVFNRSYEKISGLHNAAPHKLEELGKYFNEGDLIINTIPTKHENL